MSAIDWTPGPLLRGMMDGGADVRMRRLKQLEEENAKLRKAIIEANECLMTCEEVDLIYYMRDSWARDATQQSIETVEKVIGTKR